MVATDKKVNKVLQLCTFEVLRLSFYQNGYNTSKYASKISLRVPEISIQKQIHTQGLGVPDLCVYLTMYKSHWEFQTCLCKNKYTHRDWEFQTCMCDLLYTDITGSSTDVCAKINTHTGTGISRPVCVPYNAQIPLGGLAMMYI